MIARVQVVSVDYHAPASQILPWSLSEMGKKKNQESGPAGPFSNGRPDIEASGTFTPHQTTDEDALMLSRGRGSSAAAFFAETQ